MPFTTSPSRTGVLSALFTLESLEGGYSTDAEGAASGSRV